MDGSPRACVDLSIAFRNFFNWKSHLKLVLTSCLHVFKIMFESQDPMIFETEKVIKEYSSGPSLSTILLVFSNRQSVSMPAVRRSCNRDTSRFSSLQSLL